MDGGFDIGDALHAGGEGLFGVEGLDVFGFLQGEVGVGVFGGGEGGDCEGIFDFRFLIFDWGFGLRIGGRWGA